MFVSPPAESLPPPVFFHRTEASHGGTSPFGATEETVLPLTSGVKYFDATIVPMSQQNVAPAWRRECPSWSAWGTSQFIFEYLFTLVTGSMSSALFKQRFYDQYMDIIFKLSSIIEIIGRMPDGSPPPTIFQSLYHLRRLFPNGLVDVQDFVGEVGSTLLLRVFALGVAVANQAIHEQRNYNLEWEVICGIPDSYVDAFETAGLYALNGDVFDLAYNRPIYLNWLGHLGYFAEFLYARTGQIYLRSTADLVAFAHARAFSLPRDYQQDHIRPIHRPFLETLSTMLCWETGVTPLPPQILQFHPGSPSLGTSRVGRPTAADVLAVVGAECTFRLLYPLFARPSPPYCSGNSATARL